MVAARAVLVIIIISSPEDAVPFPEPMTVRPVISPVSLDTIAISEVNLPRSALSTSTVSPALMLAGLTRYGFSSFAREVLTRVANSLGFIFRVFETLMLWLSASPDECSPCFSMLACVVSDGSFSDFAFTSPVEVAVIIIRVKAKKPAALPARFLSNQPRPLFFILLASHHQTAASASTLKIPTKASIHIPKKYRPPRPEIVSPLQSACFELLHVRLGKGLSCP